jgi:hypothetical protein
MLRWGEFATQEPGLARFGSQRLTGAPAYLATVRRSGAPRVHPVTPIFTASGLYIFMEPTSPKGRDLRERGWYAMHNGVPNDAGSGGEFHIAGRGVLVDDLEIRVAASAAAGYEIADRYILFELLVNEARCLGYGDVELPDNQRWKLDPV